ncbi:hypothetical protein Glove_172g3 [Diversispora epigaea]|uniref:Uncharacterized protein n=1 Tax=Diversispora epigaea TaxID=1348612 RepID=A0A397IY54_9GLOM|nr:hypothetical protein Glove_172g3 [Diversispora epigaea]
MTRNQRFLDKMHLYKQDLLNIEGNVPIQQIDPYKLTDPWEQSIDTVFQLLRQEIIHRNRIKTLMYTYYLGELLSFRTLPRMSWLDYVQQNDISDEYRYYLGAMRTYKVFQDDREQIYRTNYLSLYVMARMSKNNFDNNFMPFVQAIRDISLFGIDNNTVQFLNRKQKFPKCTSQEWKEYNIMKSLYDFHLKKRTIANIDWYQLFVKWSEQINSIIELHNKLINIYTKDHKFNERELRAWSTFLRAAGAYNMTPWLYKKSQYQFWSKSSDPKQDHELLIQLYKMGFLINNPNSKNSTQTFWKCFSNVLEDNKKNRNGKRRVLSIVADNFNYEELQENLSVGRHIISESRKHARTNGYGAPPLDKPIFHRTKFTSEQLQQFEIFFSTKEYVNMSSYKTDNTSGLPVLYLQDCKQALWKKFHERFPNGMQRTSFMTRLDGKRFVYKENLGGLCSECNECGYQVFANIEELINFNITNLAFRNELISEVQNLRRYLRRDYAKHLKVTQSGIAIHDHYLSHCLRYAFGNCQESHPDICTNCENLFIFFKNLKENLPSNLHSNLDEFQKRLIAFMSHHARKTYLNAQLPAALSELEFDDVLIIVDYKMRINPKKARETKDEWFGKRGWTLLSILLYTKNQDTNNIDIDAFDYWSGDTKQNAWFTTSSLHGVVETLEKKSKNITVISDNGGHYHNTELMIILSHWKEWYDICIKKWIFLEADIEKVISNLSGTHVANLQPNHERENEKQKLGTIPGIRNWNEFTWIYNGEEAGHIYARPLPKFGKLNKFSPAYSTPQKSWNISNIICQENDKNTEKKEDELESIVRVPQKRSES